jgi:hypothetical protein
MYIQINSIEIPENSFECHNCVCTSIHTKFSIQAALFRLQLYTHILHARYTGMYVCMCVCTHTHCSKFTLLNLVYYT